MLVGSYKNHKELKNTNILKALSNGQLLVKDDKAHW